MYSENGLPSVTPWRGNSTQRAQAHVQSWAPAGGPGLCVQPFQWPRQARGLKPKALGPVCGCGTTRCSSAQVSHTRINRSPARWAARPGPGHQGPAVPGLATRGGATTSEAGRDCGRAGRLPSPEKQMPPTGPQRARRPRTHSGCRMTSSYKAFCRLDRRHFNTCSYFFVSCFSTSLLVLLRIKGCVTWGNTAAAACPWRHARRRPAPRPPPRPHVLCAGV